MQYLLDLLYRSTNFLEKKGVENPRLDVELIFAHVLGCRRMDLYLQFERPLEETELETIRPLLMRRARREALQYILGEVDFFNLKLKVDQRTLIPRPETEELVDLISKTLSKPPATILDLGTGNGAIALALAKYYSKAHLAAADQSADALALARENAVSCGIKERITFFASDWFSRVEGIFELIVANPPYLSEAEWRSAPPEVREHEPHSALVADEEGLADLRLILSKAQGYLKRGGLLALETGISHHDALSGIAQKSGYRQWESHRDLRGCDRFFLVWY